VKRRTIRAMRPRPRLLPDPALLRATGALALILGLVLGLPLLAAFAVP
jgi:hypothetical protein